MSRRFVWAQPPRLLFSQLVASGATVDRPGLLDGRLIAWLAAHWETLLLILLLGGAGLWVFRAALAVYGHIFFPARAVRNALIKAVLMVALLFVIYALPNWLAQTLLPAGWLRNLWAIVSILLFNALWEPAGRLLDRLLVGR